MHWAKSAVVTLTVIQSCSPLKRAMSSAAIASRRVAAVVGALVADAAAQPLHWIYNEDKLNGIIGNKEEVEFWEPSQNPFYRIPSGWNTCYGDQSYVILKSLVDKKGVDVGDMTSATVQFFGRQSDYEDPENSCYKVGQEDKINVKPTLPISRPWRHASIKDFLNNVESGKTATGSQNDDQIDCVIRMVPVVAMYAGHPEMLHKVETVLRVTQDSDTAVAIGLAAARFLEQIILHGETEVVLEKVIADLSDKARQNPQELDRGVVSHLRQVQTSLSLDHHAAVTKNFRKD